jgi:hypothetical protein
MCPLAGISDGVASDWPIVDGAGEEPLLGADDSPVARQRLEQSRGEHDIAILLPFALFDPQHHALAVDGAATLQMCGLGNTQAGRVASGQDRAMLEAFYTTKEVQDLLWAEHDGQTLRRLGARDAMIKIPVASEGRPVKKPKRSDCHLDRSGRQLLSVDQVDLVGTDIFWSQKLR